MDRNQRGIIHLLPLVVVFLVVILVVFIFLLFSKGAPFKAKEPKVQLKTEYQNPFDKKTQYVNPFDQYKSPFHTLR